MNTPMIPEKEKNWATIVHLSAFGQFIFPFFGCIWVPLIIWLIKRERGSFVDSQGKEVINFNLTIVLAWVISILILVVATGLYFGTASVDLGNSFDFCISPLCVFFKILALIGIFSWFFGLLVFWFICTLVGAIKANDGQHYRYPLTIRFLR